MRLRLRQCHTSGFRVPGATPVCQSNEPKSETAGKRSPSLPAAPHQAKNPEEIDVITLACAEKQWFERHSPGHGYPQVIVLQPFVEDPQMHEVA